MNRRLATARKNDRIKRQSFTNQLSHWLIALSIFVLFITGIGQMPVYARYGIAGLPGMAWTADYSVTLALHYIASAVLAFAVTFHLAHAVMTRSFHIMPRRGDLRESAQIIAAMFGRGEEPDSHKYLAEQRLAYAFIGISTLVVLASGVVKVVKNMPGSQVGAEVIWFSTLAHNVSAILLGLGIAGHLVAFVFKINRKLLPAMFGGWIDRAYAEERHSLWYREIVPPTELHAEAGAEAAETSSAA